jgi:hypothetical protein
VEGPSPFTIPPLNKRRSDSRPQVEEPIRSLFEVQERSIKVFINYCRSKIWSTVFGQRDYVQTWCTLINMFTWYRGDQPYRMVHVRFHLIHQNAVLGL